MEVDEVKEARNKLIVRMRRQGSKYKDIQKLISRVYPTDTISLTRCFQIYEREEQREYLRAGHIPEIGDELEFGGI